MWQMLSGYIGQGRMVRITGAWPTPDKGKNALHTCLVPSEDLFQEPTCMGHRGGIRQSLRKFMGRKWGIPSFCCFCLNAQPMPSGVSETSSNVSPTCEIPKALINLTSILAFSKAVCCLAPQFHECPFLARWYNGWKHWDKWGIIFASTPEFPQKPAALLHFLVWERLVLCLW